MAEQRSFAAPPRARARRDPRQNDNQFHRRLDFGVRRIFARVSHRRCTEGNFGQSSRLGSGDTFVIEADEYDTAFFDKRAKFVHYPATALGINNIEHDHADIYPNVASIQRQFHHWIRQTPSNAQIVVGAGDANVDDTLRMGCWTPVQTAGIGQGDWSVKPVSAEFDRFDVYFREALQARVEWSSFGAHNAANATVAIALAKAAGVDPSTSAAALNQFKAPARRLQAVAPIATAATYLDFAHHPTAVRRTLEALKARYEKPLIAVVEPRSNTMRAGTHKRDLLNSLTLGESAWVGETRTNGVSNSPTVPVDTKFDMHPASKSLPKSFAPF